MKFGLFLSDPSINTNTHSITINSNTNNTIDEILYNQLKRAQSTNTNTINTNTLINNTVNTNTLINNTVNTLTTFNDDELEMYRLKIQKDELSAKMDKLLLGETQLIFTPTSINTTTTTSTNSIDDIRQIALKHEQEVCKERKLIYEKFNQLQSKQVESLKSTLDSFSQRELLQQQQREKELELQLQQRQRQKEQEIENMLKVEKEQKQKNQELLEQSEQLKQSELLKHRQRVEEEVDNYLSNNVNHDQLLFGSQDAINQANKYIQLINNVKDTINKDIKMDKVLMNEALKCRMKLTTKIGAVTFSKAHILQFAREINDILHYGKTISSQLYNFLLYNLSKQLIKQAENEVAANIKKAYPLAALSCLTFQNHPIFLDYLLGRIMKKCIYCIPHYPKKNQGEGNEELMKRMGYKIIEGKFETESVFIDRMKGIISLYAAILQTTNINTDINMWTFVARLLNMKPRRISLDVIETVFRVCGNEFITRYPRQGRKIVEYLKNEYLPRSIGTCPIGNQVRLELLLQEYFEKGNFTSLVTTIQ